MKINFKRLIIITIITFVVGSFFSWFTMNNMDTFKELEKPINVPGILFPIVWSTLYLLMSISCYIITNSNNIIVLLIVVVIMVAKFYNIDKRAAYLNIPYVLWVIFAGYLNFGIYLLNR